MVVPFVATVEAMPPVDLPIRVVLEGIDRDVRARNLRHAPPRSASGWSSRKCRAFPALAEFYYRERHRARAGRGARAAARAVERGELRRRCAGAVSAAPRRARHLLAVIWNGLFERFAPLDVAAMMRTHLDLMLGKGTPMSTNLSVLAAAVAAAGVAACDEKPQTYQGWVEANLIFVAPDETGRVEKLSVREGDTVEAGAPLFTVDDELQRADVNLNTAHLTWRSRHMSAPRNCARPRPARSAIGRGEVRNARLRGAGEFLADEARRAAR